jgi:tagaturonate epimerase
MNSPLSLLPGTPYPASLIQMGRVALWLVYTTAGKRLAVLAPFNSALVESFHGEVSELADGRLLQSCPLDTANARALRFAVPNLQPAPLGLVTSVGFGDRLGLATPGHVRALEKVNANHPGKTIAPIFAQQSVRELARTGRSAEQVLADATWGAVEGGWPGSVGADADHLKTPADIDRFAAAGYSFFTIDPGAFVDSTAGSLSGVVLEHKAATLPWPALESTLPDLLQRLAGKQFDLDTFWLTLEREQVLRAAVKYGAAVAHVTRMYRHLESKGIPFELEVSVDETETPTTHAEHIYVASELRRLGVQWVSLAPRFVGRFEKGVDYIGDLDALAVDLAGHAAVARALGPYKLSLHSGSDKFSVYGLACKAAGGTPGPGVHLKTAGTSLLEGLRTLAQVDPGLFRKMLALSIERYPLERASYHVSAELARVPDPASLPDAALPALLDQFDARQVLHVTFGSLLERYGSDLRRILSEHAEEYYQALERHFVRHLEPLV